MGRTPGRTVTVDLPLTGVYPFGSFDYMAETLSGASSFVVPKGAAEQYKLQQEIPFEQQYQMNKHAETVRVEQDGQATKVACYELVIDMKNSERRADAVSEFMLSAAKAGYRGVMGPLVFPPGEQDGVFGSIFFTLEQPKVNPSAINPLSPK